MPPVAWRGLREPHGRGRHAQGLLAVAALTVPTCPFTRALHTHRCSLSAQLGALATAGGDIVLTPNSPLHPGRRTRRPESRPSTVPGTRGVCGAMGQAGLLSPAQTGRCRWGHCCAAPSPGPGRGSGPHRDLLQTLGHRLETLRHPLSLPAPQTAAPGWGGACTVRPRPPPSGAGGRGCPRKGCGVGCVRWGDMEGEPRGPGSAIHAVWPQASRLTALASAPFCGFGCRIG